MKYKKTFRSKKRLVTKNSLNFLLSAPVQSMKKFFFEFVLEI